MKKKETLWELLKRLDEEAGQFSIHLSEANRYFDTASGKTRKLVKKHEDDLHKSISQLKSVLKKVIRKK